ncbi:MAG TPA: SRPBCC domain-containing protein [Devosia sp.]|nr:SRPBCC domain-containing protein [Devosia sp.]
MTAAGTETRSVLLERELASPPEKIWRALTQPHLIEEWLMKTDFKPVPGQRFTLRRDPRPDTSVVIDCEVLAVEPNQKLSYSWEAFGLESVVTFTLTPTSTGTHLRVEQSGFRPDQDRAFKGATASWRQFIAALEELLHRQP